MFALVAALFFAIGAVKVDSLDSPQFWLFIGLAAWAVGFALSEAIVPTRRRRG